MGLFLFKKLFICLFLTVLGRCRRAGFSLAAVCGLLIVMASLAPGRRFLGTRASAAVAGGLGSCGSQTLENVFSSCGAQA